MKFLRKWGLSILLLLGLGGVIAYNIHRRNQWKKDHVYIELRAFQTPKGWGYDILNNGRIYIHQDIIPAISAGGRGFRTKEDALAVGQKVYQRVIAGKMPMISPEEIKAMGIVPADTLQR
jgi:hypothetical protein